MHRTPKDLYWLSRGSYRLLKNLNVHRRPSLGGKRRRNLSGGGGQEVQSPARGAFGLFTHEYELTKVTHTRGMPPNPEEDKHIKMTSGNNARSRKELKVDFKNSINTLTETQ